MPKRRRSVAGNFIYAGLMILYGGALINETFIKKTDGSTFLLEIEKDFHGVPWSTWTLDNLPSVVVVTFWYLALVFAGPTLIGDKGYVKGCNGPLMRLMLLCWNVLLALFSMWGSFRIVPWFVT